MRVKTGGARTSSGHACSIHRITELGRWIGGAPVARSAHRETRNARARHSVRPLSNMRLRRRLEGGKRAEHNTTKRRRRARVRFGPLLDHNGRDLIHEVIGFARVEDAGEPAELAVRLRGHLRSGHRGKADTDARQAVSGAAGGRRQRPFAVRREGAGAAEERCAPSSTSSGTGGSATACRGCCPQ